MNAGPTPDNVPSLEAHHEALQTWFRDRLDDPGLELGSSRLLEGGAVQRNWKVELGTATGAKSYVVRSGPEFPLPESRSKESEYAMLRRMFEHGVPVCEPLWLERSVGVIGRDFIVSEVGDGVAEREHLYGARDRDKVGAQLAAALAAIHAVPVPDDLPAETPAMRVVLLSTWADTTPDVHEGITAGLAWLHDNAPDPDRECPVHRDFRTGNFLVADAELKAVLDWEFAGAGDPAEDIGWFCARCWRGPNTDAEAGGLTGRQAFYDAYTAAGGAEPDTDRVHFWEVFAHVRWALIAMQQGARAEAGEYPRDELVEAVGRVPGLAEDIAALVA